MQVIVVINEKGGVGKSTTSVNLAAYLAEMMPGRVIIADMDPQGNTTSHLGVVDDGTDLLKAIEKPKKADLGALIKDTDYGLSMIPSGRELASAERTITPQIGSEKLLSILLDRVAALGRWDVCIIDCPPQLGILSIGALAAANWALIPVETSFFGVEGLVKIMETIEMVKDRVNPKLALVGLLACRLRKGTKASGEILEKIRSSFGNLVFDTVIHENIKLAEAPSHGEPISRYDRKSQGALDYGALAVEVVKRIKLTRGIEA
jgi:chromosome partitioning protein